MPNPGRPIELPDRSIHQQIREVASHLNLTAYGISQFIAAETDPTETERKRTEVRWQRWLKGENLKTLESLESDLDALGYCIKIERKLP